MVSALQPGSGARDFYPADQRQHNYLLAAMRRIPEQFGYEPYAAAAASSGSHMVAAKRQGLLYPLRWFTFAGPDRYELRTELYGVSGLAAEAEVIQVADQLVRSIGATPAMYSIRLGSRRLMHFILREYVGLDAGQQQVVLWLMERLPELGLAAFAQEAANILQPHQRVNGGLHKLAGLLRIRTIDHLPELIRQHGAVTELKQLMQLLQNMRISNAQFDLSAVGADHHTGIVFQIAEEAPAAGGLAIAGGGRHDNAAAATDAGQLPAVSCTLGVGQLVQLVRRHNLLPALKTETDVYAVLKGDVFFSAQNVIAEMREMGASVAVDISGHSVEKQLETARRKGVHYALTIDARALDDGQFELSNLLTGATERHSIARIISIVKDYREDARLQ